MQRLSLPYAIAAVALPLLLSACDIGGIGDGSRPERLEIRRASAMLDPTSNVSYRCFTDQLQVVAYFNDGQIGDFTSRTALKWSSSDETVVQVSNADLPVPGNDDLRYSRGVLVPRNEGTATITARFSDLQASYEVEVVDPATVQLASERLAIAPNTLGQLRAQAIIDGEEVDITSSALWSFVGDAEENAEYAVIGAGTGVVLGKKAGQLLARAKFPLCEDLTSDLEADVVISPVASLAVSREFDEAPNDELVKGTTELLTTEATLQSGDKQDLTTQVTYKATGKTGDDKDVMSTNAVAVINLVRGNEEGSATVVATYKDVDEDPDDEVPPYSVDSDPVPFNVVEDTLTAIAITPGSRTLRPGTRLQLVAEGTYAVVPRKQLITRHVSWTSSDTTLVAVGVGVSSGGLVVAGTKETDKPVTITAKFTIGSGDDAQTVEQTVKVCVFDPDAEPEEGEEPRELPEDCPPMADEDEEAEEEDEEPEPPV